MHTYNGYPVPKWVKTWWATTNSVRVNFQLKYLNCVVVALIELEIWFPEDICYHSYITKLVKIVMWTLSKMWSCLFDDWPFPIHLLPRIIGNSISVMCDFTINAHDTHTQLLHICSCSENELVNRERLVYVGGINPLSLTNENASRSDFVGAIRNVVIGQSQVNLGCPQEEQHTLIGKNQRQWIKKKHFVMDSQK